MAWPANNSFQRELSLDIDHFSDLFLLLIISPQYAGKQYLQCNEPHLKK